jgi:hypothetical protein
MSRTLRAYNKPTYFRRVQQQYEMRWIFVPQYHPYKQNSHGYFNFVCWDMGKSKRWYIKRRRLQYQDILKEEMLNL